jgi:hypothetical protein
MPARRSPKTWLAVIMIFMTAIALAPILRAQKAGLTKICPITIEVDPESVLAKHCAAKVESDNALLSAFFVQLREKKVTEKMPQPVTLYPKPLTPEDFAGTYLRDPVLTKPDGTTIEHWGPIVSFFLGAGGMIDDSTYIDVQSVHVTVTPIKGNADIDFSAQISTVIAYAPYDAPYVLSGGLCHRNLCEWLPSPCPPIR